MSNPNVTPLKTRPPYAELQARVEEMEGELRKCASFLSDWLTGDVDYPWDYVANMRDEIDRMMGDE